MLVIHERLAELWTVKKHRELTNAELDEIAICLEANANYVWRMNKLANLSLLASMTDDTEWQHEICARIEKLQYPFGQQK